MLPGPRVGVLRVVGAVATVVALTALSGCRDDAGPARADAVGGSTMRVKGYVLVRDLDAVRLNQDLEICHTLAPYADVQQGETVTVRVPGGRVLARGPLLSGRLVRGTGRGSGCGFAFDLLRVPWSTEVEVELPGHPSVRARGRSVTSVVLPVG